MEMELKLFRRCIILRSGGDGGSVSLFLVLLFQLEAKIPLSLW
jgi:hypothetical protein